MDDQTYTIQPAMNSLDLTWMVIIGTLVLASFIGFIVLLMLINNNRRIRHRAEVAELHMQREQEVINAEREATRQTLREVGRELHDNVGQLLTVAQMGINAALETHPDQRMDAARDALDQGVEEIRRLAHDLDTELWRTRSFVDAIVYDAQRIERVGRVQVHVLREGEMPTLSAETSTILFRVFQEVVNNALKHSGAGTIEIALHAGPPFRITIADDGRGFEEAKAEGHSGLHNIRHRCALVGFDAQCMSSPGKGCTWIIQQRTEHAA